MGAWLRARRRTDWLLIAIAVLLTVAVAHDIVHRAGRADRRLAARRELSAYVRTHGYIHPRVVQVYLRDRTDLICANVRPVAHPRRRVRVCMAIDRHGRRVGRVVRAKPL